MKHVGVAALLLLMALLGACSETVNSEIESTSAEMYKPDAKIAYASDLSLQGLNEASSDADTKVVHEHTFSNGEVYTYTAIDGFVVEGDVLLGTLDELDAAIEAYEEHLANPEAADAGEIETQGAFVEPYCEFRLIFCFSSAGKKWKNGIVYYQPITTYFDERRDGRQIKLIGDAMEYISSVTDIEFEERSSGDRIVFKNPGNRGTCSSKLGRTGGAQTINLGGNCFSAGPGDKLYGKVVHEIGHAIGLVHEHQRIDRDSFITVNKSNLTKTGRSQIGNIYEDLAYYLPYDYDSIMHYPSRMGSGFARDSSVPVFTCKFRSKCANVGQRAGFSQKDINTINRYY